MPIVCLLRGLYILPVILYNQQYAFHPVTATQTQTNLFWYSVHDWIESY